MVIKNLCLFLVFWTKVASALEGLMCHVICPGVSSFVICLLQNISKKYSHQKDISEIVVGFCWLQE